MVAAVISASSGEGQIKPCGRWGRHTGRWLQKQSRSPPRSRRSMVRSFVPLQNSPSIMQMPRTAALARYACCGRLRPVRFWHQQLLHSAPDLSTAENSLDTARAV